MADFVCSANTSAQLPCILCRAHELVPYGGQNLEYRGECFYKSACAIVKCPLHQDTYHMDEITDTLFYIYIEMVS